MRNTYSYFLRRAIELSQLLALLMVSPNFVYAEAACTPGVQEQQIWDYIGQSTDPLLFMEYLKQYPQGCFRAVAIFKIRALVEASVPLRVNASFTGGRADEKKEGEWLEGRMVEQLRVESTALDPSKFHLELQCSAAGKGESGWGKGACHPNGSAPLQGFSVRMGGTWRELYDLEVNCVVTAPGGDRVYSKVPSGGWCGVRSGAGVYIYKVMLTAKLKSFN